MPIKKKVKKKLKSLSFQEIIMSLQKFWGKMDVVLQPYDLEVGAGTFHPATTLRSLGPKTVESCLRAAFEKTNRWKIWREPNRLQHYYQFQVIIKPSPKNIKQTYLKSLASIGIDVENHDIRFVEDDWEKSNSWCSRIRLGSLV